MSDTKPKIGDGYHIVVVDDEQKVAKFITELLKSKGFEVTTLNDSVQAKEFVLANKTSVDLVITDQTMPNLTGAELAKSLLEARPDLPIFLVTGYSEEVDSEKAAEIGIKEYIAKPLRLAELSELLQKYLPPHSQSKSA